MAYVRGVFGHKIPLMLMDYLGTLKTWLYLPVFHFWAPSASSVRTPMVLAGAATLWLFFVMVRKVAGPRAAVIGVVLLATDVSFLLTTVYDWGPVALQHLLFVGGLTLLVRFHAEGGRGALAGAFFLFGLAMWDKAIFTWNLAALAAAGLAVFPRQLWRAATLRNAGAAALAFSLGALPLILYNASHRLSTFRANTIWSAEDLAGKARLARYAFEGNALFGYVVSEVGQGETRPPRSAIERGAAALAAWTGDRRHSLAWWGFMAALALCPWLWRRHGWQGPVRIAAFAVVFLTAGWLQMALNRGTGGGLHHIVLLWPIPHMLMAVVFAAALPRRAAAVVAAVLVASNLLVLNTYYVQARRDGSAVSWTDAIFDLSVTMRQIPARNVYVLDWGIVDSLRLLNRGTLPLYMASDPVTAPAPTRDDRAAVHVWTSSPANVFVSHTEGSEFFAGAARKMEAMAAEFGVRRETLAVIADRNGRPRFQVFRFVGGR